MGLTALIHMKEKTLEKHEAHSICAQFGKQFMVNSDSEDGEYSDKIFVFDKDENDEQLKNLIKYL